MKKMRAIAIVLCIVLCFGIFAGCGKKDDAASQKGKATTESSQQNGNGEQPAKKTQAKETAKFPEKIELNKIGSLKYNNITVTDGGVIYSTDDGMYGITSFDGKKDTGAVYLYCKGTGNYFTVISKQPDSTDSVASMNVCGLVDVDGKEIIPEKFASISALNENYIEVIEATEVADSREDAILYSTDRLLSIYANDDDTFYKGKWCVYDVRTGKTIKGAEGTKSSNVFAKGNIVSYRNDSGKTIMVNADGSELPEFSKLFDDGSYLVNDGDNYVIYDADGSKLFSVAKDEFYVYACDGTYFTANKVDTGSGVLLDRSGNMASKEFDGSINVYGDVVLCKGKVYDFDGKELTSDEIVSVYFDKFTKSAYLFKGKTKDVMMTNDGTVLYDGEKSSNISLFDDFVISNNESGKYYYYNHAQGDFTIKGSACGSWLVESPNEDYTKNLVDSISGNILLENYKSFTAGTNKGGKYYIYAKNADDEYEVYELLKK